MNRFVLLATFVSALALADVPRPPSPAEPAAPIAEAPPPVADAPAEPVAAPAPAPAPAPQHPMGIEKAGPSGVIEGGWPYVIASYAVAFLGVGLYALSLVMRRQKPGVTP